MVPEEVKPNRAKPPGVQTSGAGSARWVCRSRHIQVGDKSQWIASSIRARNTRNISSQKIRQVVNKPQGYPDFSERANQREWLKWWYSYLLEPIQHFWGANFQCDLWIQRFSWSVGLITTCLTGACCSVLLCGDEVVSFSQCNCCGPQDMHKKHLCCIYLSAVHQYA